MDLPGYGFSVAAPREQRRWDAAGLAYVRARAPLAAAVFPCCGTTGAGVDALWGALAAHAEGASERPHGARGVPIHRSALKKS